MKFRAIFVVGTILSIFAMPASAWPSVWSGPYAYHEPTSFYQANQVAYQKFSLSTLANQSANQEPFSALTHKKIQKHATNSWNLSKMLLTPEARISSDVPFVFRDNLTSIAGYSSNEIVNISASSTFLNKVPKKSSPDRWGYEEEFDAKIEADNRIVREEVVMINDTFTGDPDIGNICSIYKYYKYGDNKTLPWRYINDPKGKDWAYANESIQIGKKGGFSAAGDCDDFAIVIASLTESIGGTWRIVVGINKDKSHAFAEVYLGQDKAHNSDVAQIINWLMNEFNTDIIYTHVDPDKKDVWLNLDWWPSYQGGPCHPGSPFYEADEYVIYDSKNPAKTPLRPRLTTWG